MLASLVMVDAVVIFEEDTPLDLIKLVQPDVLVKGGDYTLEEIVGARKFRPLVDGLLLIRLFPDFLLLGLLKDSDSIAVWKYWKTGSVEVIVGWKI
jgi:D-beta-D-heptose 7-phosphate kinase/D-beta-D-heptose 1-phosphate adenosyltransferase